MQPLASREKGMKSMKAVHHINGLYDNSLANIRIVEIGENVERPMTLARVKAALKESYKCAACGSWIETYYFDAILTVIFVERDAFGKVEP